MREKQPSEKALAKAAQDYIESHSTERFSLREMAGALYVNGSYLLRVFKHSTGMTPLHYHHLIRCRRAKELLSQTDRTISEIGEAVGFVSSSHFSHIFRKTEGCTPSEYRARSKPAGQEGAAP
jgi:two-component system response regulator YesN